MLQGYLLGSYMYLSIVFIVPLSLGVVAVALDLPLNTDEALEGLVMPASAYVLLGKGGQLSPACFHHPAPGRTASTLSLGAKAMNRTLWCLSHLLLLLSNDSRCSIQILSYLGQSRSGNKSPLRLTPNTWHD